MSQSEGEYGLQAAEHREALRFAAEQAEAIRRDEDEQDGMALMAEREGVA